MTPKGDGAATFVEFAPAKINLYLHLTGRRPDGYHLISSLIAFADVGDEIAVGSGAGLTLTIEGPFAAGLSNNSTNLVMRAAASLAEALGVPANAAIRLTKRLPVSSGIGGGSADAAATLRALIKLWRKEPSAEALARLGLSLGADIPVCLRGRPTLVSGIGEILEPAPKLPPVWLALVNPGVAVATREVFAARQADFSEPLPLTIAPTDAASFAVALRERGNDLADPARRIAPAIGEVLSALGAAPGCLLARMSGSGATCFGLFAAAGAAQTAVQTIGAAHPNWWSVAAKLRP